MKMVNKFIGSYPVGTKLRVRLVAFEDGWTKPKMDWLRANLNKDLDGAVVLEDESLYFRPDASPGLILHDDEIDVIEEL